MRFSAVIGLFFVAGLSCSSADRRESPLLMRPFLAVIQDHRETGTKFDGGRCPLYPTCAHYAGRALQEHSFLGLLVFVDRLFNRELGDLGAKYMLVPRRMSESPRFFDPIEDSLPLFSTRRPSLFREDLSR